MDERFIQALYNDNNLSELGSFDEFKVAMQNPAFQSEFHKSYLSSMGTLEEFQSALNRQQESLPVTEPKTGPVQMPTPASPEQIQKGEFTQPVQEAPGFFKGLARQAKTTFGPQKEKSQILTELQQAPVDYKEYINKQRILLDQTKTAAPVKYDLYQSNPIPTEQDFNTMSLDQIKKKYGTSQIANRAAGLLADENRFTIPVSSLLDQLSNVPKEQQASTFNNLVNDALRKVREQQVYRKGQLEYQMEQETAGIPQTFGEAISRGELGTYAGSAIGGAAGSSAVALTRPLVGGYELTKGEILDMANKAKAESLGQTENEFIISGGKLDSNAAVEIGSLVSSALEYVGLGKIASPLFKNLVKEGTKSAIKKGLVEVGKGAATEFSTEFVQSVNEQVSSQMAAGKKPEEIVINWDDALESGIQGGIGGGGLTTVSTVTSGLIDAVAKKRKVEQIDNDINRLTDTGDPNINQQIDNEVTITAPTGDLISDQEKQIGLPSAEQQGAATVQEGAQPEGGRAQVEAGGVLQVPTETPGSQAEVTGTQVTPEVTPQAGSVGVGEEVEATAKSLKETISKDDIFAFAAKALPIEGTINYKDILSPEGTNGLPFETWLNKPEKLDPTLRSSKKIYDFLKSGGVLENNVILLDKENRLLDGYNRLKAQLALGITDFKYAIGTKEFIGTSGYKFVAEAYHKAKADGSNPELVKAVEQSLKETTQTAQVTPQVEAAKQVPAATVAPQAASRVTPQVFDAAKVSSPENLTAIETNSKAEIDKTTALPTADEGGATFNLDGTTYTGGGVVVPVTSVNLTKAEMTPQRIAQFVKDNAAKIGADNVKVGIYKFPNQDKYSVDLNIVVPQEFQQQGLDFARAAGQESIFDLTTFDNIKTGATGMTPATFTDEQFKQIAADLAQGKVPQIASAEVTAERQKAEQELESALGVTPVSERNESEIQDAIDSATAALASLGVEVQALSSEEYSTAAKKLGAEETSRGMFVSEEGVIYINKDLLSKGIANNTVIWHEASHPVVNIIRNTNRKLYNQVISGLKQLAKTNEQVATVQQWAQLNYADQTQAVIDDEFLVETIANIADGRLDLSEVPTSFRQTVIDFINKLAEMLGLGKVLSDTDMVAVKNLTSDISEALLQGKDISTIVGIENTGRIESTYIQQQVNDVFNGILQKIGIKVGTVNPNTGKVKVTNFDVATALNKYYKKQLGIIKVGTKYQFGKQAGERISDYATDEVVFALNKFGNNSGKGWYTTDYAIALDLLKEFDPDIVTNPDIREIATIVIAIASNSTDVYTNLSRIIYAVDQFKKTGKVPTDVGVGKGMSAIATGVETYNNLLDLFDGDVQALQQFMSTERTVSESKEALVKKANLKSWAAVKEKGLATDPEWNDNEILPTSVIIFGPKIGAFWSNLSGLGGTPTIDRWCIRTVYRYFGDMRAKALPAELNAFRKENNIEGLSDDETLAIAEEHSKIFNQILTGKGEYKGLTKEVRNEKLKPYRKGSQIWTKASGVVNEIEDGLTEAVSNKAQYARDFRSFTKRVFEKVQSNVLQKTGENLTISDIQAILWLYEKQLFGTIGVKQRPDATYSSAAQRLVNRLKAGEFTIEQMKAGKLKEQEDVIEEDGPMGDTYAIKDKDFELGLKDQQNTLKSSLNVKPKRIQYSRSSSADLTKKKQNPIVGTPYEKHMTSDNKDNFIFFHTTSADYKDIKPGLDSRKFYSTRTSRDEKALQYGVASYYTKPTDSEPMVLGDSYYVKVPMSKVYPMNTDPNGYEAQAEQNIPKNEPFRYEKVRKEMARLAKDDGYQMAVAYWGLDEKRGSVRRGMLALRGDALVPLKPKPFVGAEDFNVGPQYSKRKLTDKNKASVTRALVKVGEDMIKTGEATIDNVIEKLRNFTKGKYALDISGIENDILSAINVREAIRSQEFNVNNSVEEFTNDQVEIDEEESFGTTELVDKMASYLAGKVTNSSQVKRFVDEWNKQNPDKEVKSTEVWNKIDGKPVDEQMISTTLTKIIQEKERTKKLAGKDAVKQFKDIVQYIRDAVKGTKLTWSQTKAILSKLKGITYLTPERTAKVKTYVDKVVADAKVAQKIHYAEKLRKKLKKAPTKTAAPIKAIAKKLASIEITDENIDEFIIHASSIINSFARPDRETYAGVRTLEIEVFIDNESRRQENELTAALLSAAEESEAKYKSALTIAEAYNNPTEQVNSIDDIVDEQLNLSEEKKRITRENLIAIATGMRNMLRDFPTIPGRAKEKAALERFNPTTATLDTIVQYIKVVNNAILNNNFAGTGRIIASINAQSNVNQAIAAIKANRRVISALGRFGRVYTKFASNVAATYDKLMGGKDAAIEFLTYIGLADYLEKNAQFIEEKNEIQRLVDAKITEINDKYKVNVLSEENQIKRRVLSELAKYVNDPTASVPKVIRNIEADIKELLANNNPELTPIADQLYELLNDMRSKGALNYNVAPVTDPITGNVKFQGYEFSDGDITGSSHTVQGYFEKNHPAVYELWDYNQKIYNQKNVFNRASEVNEKFYNELMNEYKFYSATVFRKVGEGIVSEDAYPVNSLRPAQSNRFKEATRSRKAGYTYSYIQSFTDDMNALFEVLHDIYTTESQFQFAESIVRPELIDPNTGLFTGQKRDFVIQDYKRRTDIDKQAAREKLDELALLLDTGSRVAKNIANTTRLFSVKQVIAQWLPAYGSLVAILGNKAPLLHQTVPDSFDDVLKLTPAALRSAEESFLNLNNKFNLTDKQLQGYYGKAFKALGGVEKGSKELSSFMLKYPIGKPDFNIYKRGWVALYTKSLMDQGVTDVNLETENTMQEDPRRVKARYTATFEMTKLMAASDPASKTQLSKSRGYLAALVGVMMPFSAFQLNYKDRIITALYKIKSKEGMVELGAALTESLVFASISVAWANYITDFVATYMAENLLGIDLGDDEEGEEETLFGLAAKTVSDIATRMYLDVNPMAISYGENVMLRTANFIEWLSSDTMLNFNEWLADQDEEQPLIRKTIYDPVGYPGMLREDLTKALTAGQNLYNAYVPDQGIYVMKNKDFPDTELYMDPFLYELAEWNAVMSTVGLLAPNEAKTAWRKVQRKAERLKAVN